MLEAGLRIRIRIKVKIQKLCWRLKLEPWAGVNAQNGGFEAHNEDSQHLMRSRIRISIKVLRSRNPAVVC
jgi:hypothetical protein